MTYSYSIPRCQIASCMKESVPAQCSSTRSQTDTGSHKHSARRLAPIQNLMLRECREFSTISGLFSGYLYLKCHYVSRRPRGNPSNAAMVYVVGPRADQARTAGDFVGAVRQTGMNLFRALDKYNVSIANRTPIGFVRVCLVSLWMSPIFAAPALCRKPSLSPTHYSFPLPIYLSLTHTRTHTLSRTHATITHVTCWYFCNIHYRLAEAYTSTERSQRMRYVCGCHVCVSSKQLNSNTSLGIKARHACCSREMHAARAACISRHACCSRACLAQHASGVKQHACLAQHASGVKQKKNMYLYLYLYTHTHTHTHKHIYIYI
jgi:hypothetical protein